MLKNILKFGLFLGLIVSSLSADAQFKQKLLSYNASLTISEDNLKYLKEDINDELNKMLDFLKLSKSFIKDGFVFETNSDLENDKRKNIQRYNEMKEKIIELVKKSELK